MRKYFYGFMLAGALAACKGNGDSNDLDTASSAKKLDQSPGLIQQFKPVIAGAWVKKNYIKKAIRRRSPLAAADKEEGITSFFIDTSKLKGDNMMVSVSWNNKDDREIALKFQPGKNTTTIMLGNDELSYNIKKNDTTLTIYHYDDKTRETTSDKYIKGLNIKSTNDAAFSMNYMINKSMVSGAYNATDNTGKRFKVVFTDDGHVKGYTGYTNYQIQNHYGEDPRNKMDIITFKGKDQKSLEIKIEKKRLTLFESDNPDKPAIMLTRDFLQ